MFSLRSFKCTSCGAQFLGMQGGKPICDECKEKGAKPKLKTSRHQVKCSACGFVILDLKAFQADGIEMSVHYCSNCGSDDKTEIVEMPA